METILIIEDTLQLRENIAEVLTMEGFSVLQADNGTTGVQIAMEQFPDLVLCDIMMPGHDGYEVLQMLKRPDGQIRYPFIFISALDERKNVREGMELGADDYLIKPFTVSELLKAVRVRLERHRSIESRIRSEIDQIEQELQKGMLELGNIIEEQKNLLDEVISEKDKMAGELGLKEDQLMKDALRAIEINTTFMQMSDQLSDALQRPDLSEEQHKILAGLRNRLRNKNVLLNNQTVFQLKFDLLYPNFKTILLHNFPKLKKQDLVLLSSTYLNLDTFQQGIILNITAESVRKKRYRLKLKMGLNNSHDIREDLLSMDFRDLKTSYVN
ncbi:MAG: response regulator transcription factor [Prolixibacteraceae bacterium]